MADDERRAEIEAATDALLADSGLPRYGGHRATVERRMAIAFEAADRVRDARDDDEVGIVYALRRAGSALGAAAVAFRKLDEGHGYPPHIAAGDAKCAEDHAREALRRYDREREAARSPQGEDHEAGIEAAARAEYERSISEPYTPGYGALPAFDDVPDDRKAAQALGQYGDVSWNRKQNARSDARRWTAYLSRVSSSRDGTVAVAQPEPDALGGQNADGG